MVPRVAGSSPVDRPIRNFRIIGHIDHSPDATPARRVADRNDHARGSARFRRAWLVQLEGVAPTAGPNWTAIEAQLRASRGSAPIVLRPQTRYFSDPPTETNEAAIRTFWNGQLYTVIGKPDPSGAWQLRLWWKPFVTLIWAGGGIIALGGALGLVGRALRAWRVRRKREPDWRRRYA